MKIRKGVCGDDQMSSFDNATLQSGGSYKVEFSIAAFVELPEKLHKASEEEVAQYLENLLGRVEYHGLSFEVEIGPAYDGTPEDDEEKERL